MPRSAIPFLVVAVLAWGWAFPAIRSAVKVLSPGELVIGRLLVASVGLIALMIPRLRKKGIPPAADLAKLFVVGLLGMSVYQLLLNIGETTVTAATAAVLINIAPVIAALFAPMILGEHLIRRQWLGIGLALAGSILVSVTAGGGLSFSWGAVAVLGSAVCAGFFILRQKSLLEHYDALEVTAWATVLSAIPALVFLPSFVQTVSDVPAVDIWPQLLWLGLGSSVLGYVFWAAGLARSDATKAAVWLYLVAPTAALVAGIWLDEVPTMALVVGAVISLTGVRLVTMETKVPEELPF